jgi:hypothetical protein
MGDLTLVPDAAPDDTATAVLNEGFQCEVTTALCTITVAGPQTTQPKNWALDETNDVLSADMEVLASRTGSLLCGPSSGTGTFTADYATTPPELRIDP